MLSVVRVVLFIEILYKQTVMQFFLKGNQIEIKRFKNFHPYSVNDVFKVSTGFFRVSSRSTKMKTQPLRMSV